jgi:hypothetical protein
MTPGPHRFRRGLVRLAAIAALGWLAAGGSACRKEKESLIVVAVTASDSQAGGLVSLNLSAGGVSKAFDLNAGLSQTASYFGLYVPAGVTGAVDVSASGAPATGCLGYTGTGTATIAAAGDTANAAITIEPYSFCAPDGGGGAGAPPSLARCVEYNHNDDPTCTLDAFVFGVAVSPNGQLVATGADDGRVKIWRFDGRTLTAEGHVLTDVGYGVVAFSPSGNLLAIGWEGKIDLWNVATWTRARSLTIVNRSYDLAFSADGTQIISIDLQNLYAHDINTSAPLHTLALPENAWLSSVSPVGATSALPIAVATTNGTVRLYTHTPTGFTAGLVLTAGTVGTTTRSVRFSPDGTLLAAGNSEGLLHLWNFPITSPNPTVPDMDVATPTTSSILNGIAFHPGGRFLAVAGGPDGAASVSTWMVGGLRNLVSSSITPIWAVGSIAFSPSGSAIISGQLGCGLIDVCAD